MLRLTILLLLIVLLIRSMGFVSRASLDFCERKSLLVRCWLQCRFGCCSKIGSIIEQVTDGMYLLEALGSRPSCNMAAEDCVLLSPQLRTIEGGSVRARSHLETLSPLPLRDSPSTTSHTGGDDLLTDTTIRSPTARSRHATAPHVPPSQNTGKMNILDTLGDVSALCVSSGDKRRLALQLSTSA